MQEPLQISYREVTPSPAIEDAIRERAGKLDELYDRITGCRVLVDSPHRRHHHGRLFHVRVEVAVPGRVIVVNREPQENHAHEDVYVAIRDAFNAAKRQLEDHVRETRGAAKQHDGPPTGRVARLFPEQRYGFIQTSDGREVYFHANSLLDGTFERLEVGTVVRFAEEAGEQGPQASSVHLAGKPHTQKRR
jgi:cold shock CspA family protein/ribosome-associated translation inhibitor RaiA